MVNRGYFVNKRFGHKNFNIKYKKNDRIRATEVRVIGFEGDQMGILPIKEAYGIAKMSGLDLVEVSPMAKPPVCRILDFGKFMYEESKKVKKTAKSSSSKTKEIKFRINIDQHDYITKIRRAEEFLYKGFKVKLTLFFRGRELQHKELGFTTIKQAIEDLIIIGTTDYEPKLMGRNINVMISPLPLVKRKTKLYIPRQNDTVIMTK